MRCSHSCFSWPKPLRVISQSRRSFSSEIKRLVSLSLLRSAYRRVMRGCQNTYHAHLEHTLERWFKYELAEQKSSKIEGKATTSVSQHSFEGGFDLPVTKTIAQICVKLFNGHLSEISLLTHTPLNKVEPAYRSWFFSQEDGRHRTIPHRWRTNDNPCCQW